MYKANLITDNKPPMLSNWTHQNEKLLQAVQTSDNIKTYSVAVIIPG